jgi:4-amino-4-deoxy-L-arabinose transferase-like glycosyltransferase
VSSSTNPGDARSFSFASIAALLLLAAMYFVRLGAGSLWDNSEPQYGEIVKEMLRGGDWLTLHKDLQPWFIHPPLWFWVAAFSAKIFGLTEFALRLPSAAFGVLGAAATYAAGRRLYGDAAGVVAAIALGVSLEFLVMSRLAIQETMLIFFMTVSTFWAYFAARDGNPRDFWIATVAAALGTLVKGPVAIVLPLATLFVWATWSKRWRSLGKLPWLPAIAVYAVIAGSWFLAETARNGPGFLAAYFGLSNVARFLSPFENQPGPPYYYVPVLIVGFFPFIAFVPQAVARAWRSGGEDGKFLLAAVLVPFVFFSAAQTKLPNYIAIAFPALAVLVGETIGAAIRDSSSAALRRSLFWLFAALAIVVAGIIVYGRLHSSAQLESLRLSLELLGWLMVPVAAVTFVAAMRFERPWIIPWGLGLMMSAFIAVVAFSILPEIEATAKPMKAMAATVMAHWSPGERICFDGVKQGFSLDYYTNGPPITSVGHNVDDVPPETYFATGQPAVCVVSPAAYRSLRAAGFKLKLIDKTQTLWLASTM